MQLRWGAAVMNGALAPVAKADRQVFSRLERIPSLGALKAEFAISDFSGHTLSISLKYQTVGFATSLFGQSLHRRCW